MAYQSKKETKHFSIRQKTSFILLIVTTVILSALCAFRYMQSRSRLLEELETLSRITIYRMAENLSLPLFDFDM